MNKKMRYAALFFAALSHPSRLHGRIKGDAAFNEVQQQSR